MVKNFVKIAHFQSPVKFSGGTCERSEWFQPTSKNLTYFQRGLLVELGH